MKFADTALFAPIVTVQVDPFELSQPVHPVNSDNVAGVAVSVTAVPITKSLLQAVPQLIPAGDDVTEPLPMPVNDTVSVNRLSMKIAVTDLAFVIETVHVAPETASQPVHPVKSEFAAGAAVSVTCESLRNCAVQVVPQARPAGDEVTVPVPSPCLTTASVSSCRTLTVVLPVLPKASVTVIVAVPRLTPVTPPLALTVATVGSLLVHVTPVPCIFTGVSELVAVPVPN